MTKAIVERFMRKLEKNLPDGAHLGGKVISRKREAKHLIERLSQREGKG